MKFLHRRRQQHQHIDLNVIPLIDVVFFLLIFYVISTSFTQESAVSIKRPASTQATSVSAAYVPVAISKNGALYLGSQAYAVSELGAAVQKALADANAKTVLIIPDRDVPTGLLLQVMDACSAAGASTVDVAAVRQ
jgi:biopolymer transport protein ExbD